jgi:hypothetical protein
MNSEKEINLNNSTNEVNNEKDSSLINISNIENDIKEYKRRKFEIDKELESKIEKFSNLSEENKNLHLVHKSLRIKLKESSCLNTKSPHKIEKRPSLQLKRNSNSKEIVTPGSLYSSPDNKLNSNRSIPSNRSHHPEKEFEDKEINRLKEDLEETELILKTKKNYMNDLRKQIKIKTKNLENIFNDISLLSSDMQNLNEEKIKIEDELNLKNKEIEILTQENKEKCNQELDQFNRSKANKEKVNLLNSFDKILQEKQNLENSVISMREEIKNKNLTIIASIETYNSLLLEIEENQNIYANLSFENFNLKKKIKKYKVFFEKYENFLKSIEADVSLMRSKLNKNKTEVDKMEEEMSNKLYFIRFSNSLVRSFFNIINTRRLQIEMIKNLDKQEKSVYDLMFKKLDEYESGLLREYREYLILCEEKVEEHEFDESF